MKQTVMLPEIIGLTEVHKAGDDKRKLEAIYGDSGTWVLRLSYYRQGEKKAYTRDVLVLYTTELDELTRWWRGVRRAVK